MALETPVKAHKKWRKNTLLLPLHLYNPLWSQESVDLCISKKKDYQIVVQILKCLLKG